MHKTSTLLERAGRAMRSWRSPQRSHPPHARRARRRARSRHSPSLEHAIRPAEHAAHDFGGESGLALARTRDGHRALARAARRRRPARRAPGRHGGARRGGTRSATRWPPSKRRATRRCARADARATLVGLGNLEVERLDDDEIARQPVEHALGRAADEQPLQPAARHGAHDDEIGRVLAWPPAASTRAPRPRRGAGARRALRACRETAAIAARCSSRDELHGIERQLGTERRRRTSARRANGRAGRARDRPRTCRCGRRARPACRARSTGSTAASTFGSRRELAVLDEQQRHGTRADQMPVDVRQQRALREIVVVRVLRDEPVVVRRGFLRGSRRRTDDPRRRRC